MIKGGADLTHLPYDWRAVVNDVIGMRLRGQFGCVFDDAKLSDKHKLAIEAFQNELNRAGASPRKSSS